MTESDYQYQIRLSEQNISNNYAEINKYNGQIEELLDMVTRLQKLGNALASASSAGSSRIERLLNSFAAAGRALKGSLFGTVGSLYSGPEYQRSCTSVEEAANKVYQKIDELQQRIIDCNNQIRSSQDTITSCRQSISMLAAESEG